MRGVLPVSALFLAVGCALPQNTDALPEGQPQPVAMFAPAALSEPAPSATLWTETKSSLFADQRAKEVGDILTVVIEIDDSAEFSNASNASRSDSSGLSIGGFFGFPERMAPGLPDGASLDNAVAVSSGNSADADGSIRRNEMLTLRMAATVVGILPNGALQISGRQNVRLNFETRLLQVDGLIRPEDISRRNEITYDRIAMATISYGGQGQINNMNRPKAGTQLLTLLPF